MSVSGTPWCPLPPGSFVRFHSGSSGRRLQIRPYSFQAVRTCERLCLRVRRSVSLTANRYHSGCLVANRLGETQSAVFAAARSRRRGLSAGSGTHPCGFRRRRWSWLGRRRRTTTTTTTTAMMTTERRPGRCRAAVRTESGHECCWRDRPWRALLTVTFTRPCIPRSQDHGQTKQDRCHGQGLSLTV